jgi:hypothetical protein
MNPGVDALKKMLYIKTIPYQFSKSSKSQGPCLNKELFLSTIVHNFDRETPHFEAEQAPKIAETNASLEPNNNLYSSELLLILF